MNYNNKNEGNNDTSSSKKIQLYLPTPQEHEINYGTNFSFYQRQNMNEFGSYFGHDKFELAMLEDEYSNKCIAQNIEPKFTFEQLPKNEIHDELIGFSGFGSIANSPNNTFAKGDLSNYFEDFKDLEDPMCHSADEKKQSSKKIEEIVKEMDEIKEIMKSESQSICNPQLMNPKKNNHTKIEEKKSMSSYSPASYDSAKLLELQSCLMKTRGVKKSEIDESIVERTKELGQQKVAEQLHIPYRRYKSILNKVGIKTNAGRKVKSLHFESMLVEWACRIKLSGEMLTRKMIKDKATQIKEELTGTDKEKLSVNSLKKVNLSKGWLDKFIKRHQEIKDYLTSQKGRKGL